MWDVTAVWHLMQREMKFLLTHPVWDVTMLLLNSLYPRANFYSHIPCGMWPLCIPPKMWLGYFYSHIPCGMWLCICFVYKWSINFYSHIPCGMWPFRLVFCCYCHIFLLTHPVWDVTSAAVSSVGGDVFLLTHPVWDVTIPAKILVCRR